MISHKHKAIFVRTTKTASSSMIDWFWQNDCRFKQTEPSLYWSGDVNHEPLWSMKHVIPEDTFNRYFKFSFIRNPFSRLVSVYFYTKKWFDENNDPLFNAKDFTDFIMRFDEPSIMSDKQGAHEIFYTKNKPCYNFVNGCDYVGKIENLNEDFEYIQNKLNLSSDIKLPWSNKTTHKDYRQYYNKKTRDRVAELYTNDLKYFNYEF